MPPATKRKAPAPGRVTRLRATGAKKRARSAGAIPRRRAGKRAAAALFPPGLTPPPDRPLVNPGLSRAQLLEIHRFMRLNRMLEDKLTALYRQGRISGGLYSSLGQEAISVGTAYALAPDDLLAPMIRNIGSMLVRGVTPLDFFQQYMGRFDSPTHGKDGTLHFGNVEKLSLIGPISHLGTLVPVMAGAALGARLRGEGQRCALTYVGDGATSTGYFHEGLNFAAVLRLPFILVVEHNGYAYSTTCEKQFRVASIAERGPAYGVAAESVDGTDVLAVYAATRRAVERGRRGEGATLLETRCLRMKGHAQHDDMRYVPKPLLDAWEKRDPLDRLERFLVAEKHATPAELKGLAASIAPALDAAADAAEKCPPPSPEEALRGVYKEEGYETPWWPAVAGPGAGQGSAA